MAEVVMRDVSRGGHVLGGARVAGLADQVSLRELLRARIVHEVAAYNDAPSEVYVGFVAPEDGIRHSDGFRMPRPRPLDADRFVTAAEQAVAAGLVAFDVDGDVVTDLDHVLDAHEVTEVTAILQRPVIARRG